MTRSCRSGIMSPVWLVFAVHALMCTVDGNGPAGAEFLKHVIGDMPKVTRKMDDRIDVEEYIPDDAPRPYHGNEIQLLSKLPVNYGHNANNPAAFPQASDTQTRIVNQGQQQPGNAIPQSVIDALSDDSKKPDATISGYDFYFYPLDNKGLQQIQNYGVGQQQQQQGPPQPPSPSMDMDVPAGNQMSAKPKVEPLFVAMAGFVGVAVVFLSALMFVPRLPIPLLSSKSVLKRAPDELAALTKLVTESIDGKDCSERIACEFGRAMRSMKVGSKPIRMMEIILPPSVAKQLAQVRRSATKREQCHFITCKNTDNGTLKLAAKPTKSAGLRQHHRPHNKTIHDVREIFHL